MQIHPVFARFNWLCLVLDNQDLELPKAHQEVDGFLPALIMCSCSSQMLLKDCDFKIKSTNIFLVLWLGLPSILWEV